MRITLLEAELAIPSASSLKEKRAVIRSIKDRVAARFNVSVAEVDGQKDHRRATLAFVTVAAEAEVAQKRLAQVQELLQAERGWVLGAVRLSSV